MVYKVTSEMPEHLNHVILAGDSKCCTHCVLSESQDLNIFLSNRISNIKKALNDTASLIINSTYILTPNPNTSTEEESENKSNIDIQVDPTNLSKQTSMAGTHGSIMVPLSPGMEGNVEEDDWMHILHWIANPYMTADLGTK